MAQWGQGDERWIVDERKDGQNVNQWHWSEKDCMGWCRQRFSELFSGIELVANSNLTASITSIDKVDGEAFLNVRKKKIIPSYELNLVMAFKASADDETVTGKVHLPYIAEENHDEDPEVQVRPDSDNAVARKVKDAIYGNRKTAIYPKVKTFVEEFISGKPAGHDGGSEPKKTVVRELTKKESDNEAGARASQKQTAPSNAKGFHKIELKEVFYAGARDMYDVFTNEARVKAFTQSDAEVKNEVGSPFKMFGGSIVGIQKELVPGKKIVQDWRFTSWPEGLYSKVTLDINESEPGHTTVSLTQEGVPEEDSFGNRTVLDTTRNGWQQLIFFKIRAVFGYGV